MGAPRPVAKGCDVDALHPPGCNDVDTDQEHGRGLDSPADSARAWQNFGADLDCAVAKSRPHANEDSGTDEEIPLPNVMTAILSKASKAAMGGAQGPMHCPVRESYSSLKSDRTEKKESLSVKLPHVKLQHEALIIHTSGLGPTGTKPLTLAEHLHRTPTRTDSGNQTQRQPSLPEACLSRAA